jgi:MarR family transcriptional regulator, organic hydroperoxide resistance regulator
MVAPRDGESRVTRNRSVDALAPAAADQRYDHLRLEDTLGFLLSDVTRTMTRIFSARIAEHGVGMGIFQFLRILWEEDGLTQRELAARTRMREPSAADALYDLERRGLVRRVADRDDRRKVRVLLTASGRKLYDLVMPDIALTNQIMLSRFSAAEQEELKGMLRRIRENLLAAELPPARNETRVVRGRARP